MPRAPGLRRRSRKAERISRGQFGQREILAEAQEIIQQARLMPADAALRNALREWPVGSEQRREVTKLVFAYYRWLGWLSPAESGQAQIAKAWELQKAFTTNPGSVSDEELRQNALPSWVHSTAELPPATLREFQIEPRLWLRARPGTAAKLAEELGDCELHPSLPDALWYRGELDLFQSPAFRAGHFEIQDISSQAVGWICNSQPGESWWDACAGEGGKTLHLADLMQNRGLVWATDRAKWRLEKLKKRAGRARIFNYRTKHWPNFEHLPLKARVDGLLVDAPCSGIGTWGRNPHARWSTTPKDVEELAALQKELLTKLAAAVKPGGRLLYSVCTLATSETTGVMEAFEQRHPEFTRIRLRNPFTQQVDADGAVWVLPHQSHGNGMFIAAWRKS